MAPSHDPPPVQRIETVDDRLRRVEQALDRLGRPTDGPPGFMATALLPAVVSAAEPATSGWGRVPLWHELRLVLAMYFDPRYRLSRPGQLGVPAVLGLMAFNYLLFNHLVRFPLFSFVGDLFERAVLIGLAVALYKLLSREAVRYEAVLSYLSRHAR